MENKTLDNAHESLKTILLEFRETMDDIQEAHYHLFTRMRFLQEDLKILKAALEKHTASQQDQG